ncbi:unnamed protein product, partial [Brassica oleracea]
MVNGKPFIRFAPPQATSCGSTSDTTANSTDEHIGFFQESDEDRCQITRHWVVTVVFLLVSHYHFGYKKDLAKRSVGKDASADAEKSMISK